jgi:hypothetical protein
MSPEIIESALRYFEAVGLITVIQTDAKRYLYCPSSVELQDAAEQALQAYVDRRTQVVKAIFSRPYGHWEESRPADGD